MKAVRIHQFGTPDVLIYEDVADLTPGPGQILIKVESASVNFADIMRRSGAPYPFPTPLPFIPGAEIGGTVQALGQEVDGPPVGTQVFALSGEGGSTGYAQYALAYASQVIPLPPGMDTDQAAALIVAGLAALLIVREVAALQPGESILIPGAGGGVGSYAIQMARLFGAGMIIGAASSPEKRQAALDCGADHAVDYTQAGWAEQVREMTGGRGADVVLETIGGHIFQDSVSCLAPFGRLVVYGMASLEPLALDQDTILRTFYNPSPNQSIHVFNLGLWFGMKPDRAGQALGDLIGLAASGRITIPVHRTLPLSQAAEAHRLIEQRRAVGKIVLKPWGDL